MRPWVLGRARKSQRSQINSSLDNVKEIMKYEPTRILGQVLIALGNILLYLSFVGCNDSPIKTVPVSGTITFNGGEWPSDGMVMFAPKTPAAGYPRKSGEAMFEKDGKYDAGTFSPKDGLVPGTYFVNLRCVESSPEDITKGTNHVPEKYRRGENEWLRDYGPSR